MRRGEVGLALMPCLLLCMHALCIVRRGPFLSPVSLALVCVSRCPRAECYVEPWPLGGVLLRASPITSRTQDPKCFSFSLGNMHTSCSVLACISCTYSAANVTRPLRRVVVRVPSSSCRATVASWFHAGGMTTTLCYIYWRGDGGWVGGDGAHGVISFKPGRGVTSTA